MVASLTKWVALPENATSKIMSLPGIASLPDMRLSEFKDQMQYIASLSAKWSHFKLLRYNGLQSESEANGIARQCAMILQKLNQKAITPTIYPFLGFESYFLGSIDFNFDGLTEDLKTCFVESRDPLLPGRHRIDTHRNFIDGKWGTASNRIHWSDRFTFENWLRFYPAVNIQLWNKDRKTFSFIAFLVGSISPQENTLSFVVTLGVQQIIAAYFQKGLDYSAYPVALRAAGVLNRENEAAFGHNLTSVNGYIPGACLECSYWLYDADKTPIRREHDDDSGIQYCIHGSTGDNLALSETLYRTIRLCSGIPSARISYKDFGKSHLPGKRKQHLTVIDLGSALGRGSDSIRTSLEEFNSAMGLQKSHLIDFRKGATKDKSFTIPPGHDSLFMAQGKPTKNATDICWNHAFVTTDCAHTFPAEWSKAGFYHDAFPVMDLSDPTSNIRSAVTFLPEGAMLARTTQDLIKAKETGIVPIVLCDETMGHTVRAATQVIGGYCYYMRECVHCAMSRVQISRKAIGFVTIIGEKGHKI